MARKAAKGKKPVTRADIQALADAGHTFPTFNEACFPEGGLSLLAAVKRLYSVSLRGCALTEADLVELGRCTQLGKLDLPDCTFPAGALEAISTLRLAMLDLSRSPVTDGDLAHVGAIASLDTLHLTGTKIGDTGVAHLAGHPGLRALGLCETRVTDDGLMGLVGCRKLGFAFSMVKGSKCTEAGVDAAFAARKAKKTPAEARAKAPAKKTTPDADSPAVAALLGFFGAYEAWSLEASRAKTDAARKASTAARVALLLRWCTTKLQADARNGGHSNPPRFAAGTDTIEQVTTRGATTTVSTRRQDRIGPTRRQYTLRQVGDQWLLDGVKESRGASFGKLPV